MAFEDLTTIDDLIAYLDKPFSRTGGKKKDKIFIYHYTCLDSLIRIFQTKSLALSSPENQNDQHEFRLFERSAWDGIYTTSFVGYHEESVAMWSMYGKEWGCAVKIGFQVEALEKAVQQSKIFSMKSNNKDRQEIIPEGKISFSSVAYKNDFTIHCGTVHNNKVLRSKKVGYLPNSFAGYIKNDIWDYEKEVRLIARIKEIIPLPEKLVIDLSKAEELWETITITPSPLYRGSLSEDLTKNKIACKQIKRNQYEGLIHISPTCTKNNCTLKKDF